MNSIFFKKLNRKKHLLFKASLSAAALSTAQPVSRPKHKSKLKPESVEPKH